jgi:hypothetical protein
MKEGIFKMNRSTITQLAKSMGTSILYSNNRMTTYQFKTEELTLNFREKIPFLSLWGGQGNIRNIPPLNVYFNRLI